jgi:branched-chain amino acid transport system substrate-binding protein
MTVPFSRKAFVAGAAALPVAAPAILRAQPSTIRIGVMFSYSGDNAAAGKELDTALATYQAQHGDTIAGKKIELVRRDTGNPNPETVRRFAQDLILNEHVSLILGLTYSPEVIAMGPVSTQAKMPVFNVNASTSNIFKDAPYISRYGFTNAQLAYPLADWAYKHGVREVYSMVSDYVAGIGSSAAFGKAFTALGGKMTGDLRVPLFAKDFSPYVARIRDAKPQAVFIFLPSGSAPGLFLKQFRESGLAQTTTVLAVGSVVEEDTLDVVGSEAIGLISSYNYSMTHNSTQNREFVRAFTRISPGLRPNYAAIAGYDAMAAVAHVLRAQNGSVDPDHTMQLVRGLKLDSPRGPISIDAQTRDVVQNIYIRRTEKIGNTIVNTEIATYPDVKDVEETYTS